MTQVSVRERFNAFHDAHPEVYGHLVKLAREWRMLRSDGSRWSIWAAFNVMRWQLRMRGLPDPHEAFKFNNNYFALYARLIMDNNPDLEGIFETRRLTTAS